MQSCLARHLPFVVVWRATVLAVAGAIPVASKVDGEKIMLDPHCNRREKSRTLLILPLSIGLGYGKHQGIIRDISASGMFLFSNFRPPIGAEIELTLTLPPPTEPQRVTYCGRVVRLTTGVTGAAIGIGLSLNGIRPAAALQSLRAALRLRDAACQIGRASKFPNRAAV